MNDSMATYLEQLALPQPVRSRVDEICTIFEALCRAPLERVFVSDEKDEASGDRSFESLWGFSGEYWMEARDFTRQFDVDISPYTHSVFYIGVKLKDMQLTHPASECARMQLEIETAKVRYSLLSATGRNCDALVSILNDLLLPNLKSTGDADGRESRALR